MLAQTNNTGHAFIFALFYHRFDLEGSHQVKANQIPGMTDIKCVLVDFAKLLLLGSLCSSDALIAILGYPGSQCGASDYPPLGSASPQHTLSPRV